MAYKLKNDMLPFPLNGLPSEGGNDLTVWVDGNSFVEPASNNWFVLCLTPQEMTDLQSVIAVGAPIVFQSDFNVMLQKYQQMAEFPNTIPEDSCMDLCALILECVQTNEALQQELGQLQNGYEVPLDQLPVDAISNTDLISDTTGCDNDHLFGAVTGLVDLLNDLAEDFLEILQNNASSVSRIAELIEVVPGVGEVVPADLITLAENFLEDLEQLYSAAYTVQLRDDFRCDLFCLYKDDCNFSIQEAIDYFAAQVTGGIFFNDFNDFIGIYLTGQFTGSSLVAAWNVWVLGMLQFGSSALGISADQMVTIVSAMFNDPDSDWSILCDCETQIIVTFHQVTGYQDYTVVDGTLDLAFGNPLPSMEADAIGGGINSVQVRVDLPSIVTVSQIGYNSWLTATFAGHARIMRLYDTNDNLLYQYSVQGGARNAWIIELEAVNIADCAYAVFVSARTDAANPDIFIDNLQLVYS